jgi:hypothetical protein
MSVDNSRPAVDQAVTFAGSAAPNKAGGAVYLQRLGADGYWYTIAVGTI